MLNFICFGSGSSGNSYYLFTENTGLLIDVGLGIRKLKKYFHEYGLPMSNIKHILITHDHADHVKSVGKLSHEMALPVYATQDVFKGIDGNYCVKNKVDFKFRHFLQKGVGVQLDDFFVTPFDVPHDSMDHVGYLIACNGVNFCLITDVGHVTDEIKERVGQANYLVLESNHDEEMLQGGPYPQFLKDRVRGPRGHLSNNECGLLLAQAATPMLRHVWLCHLSQENNHPELARKTNENILRDHGIVAGADFLLDVLKRQTPSPVYTLE